MTSTVTETTEKAILFSTHEALSTSVGLVVVLLLVVLLVQKEVVRASGTARSRAWMRALDIAIVPLLMAFALIIGERIADLVY